MTIRARNDITLSAINDVVSVTRYYQICGNKPSVPTTNPPASEWTTTEPSYTNGSSDMLYFVDLTLFSDATFKFSEVSLSSSYTAAKSAWETANAALIATGKITGQQGGYVVMRDSDNDGFPDEILIMDTSDINTATKVWRWNNTGLGFSSSDTPGGAYNGTYATAITNDGQIVADSITTGALSTSVLNINEVIEVINQNLTNGTGTSSIYENYMKFFTELRDNEYSPTILLGQKKANSDLQLKINNKEIAFVSGYDVEGKGADITNEVVSARFTRNALILDDTSNSNYIQFGTFGFFPTDDNHITFCKMR